MFAVGHQDMNFALTSAFGLSEGYFSDRSTLTSEYLRLTCVKNSVYTADNISLMICDDVVNIA